MSHSVHHTLSVSSSVSNSSQRYIIYRKREHIPEETHQYSIMALSTTRLNHFTISAFKPQNSNVSPPSSFLPSPSSFKVQNLPFRVRYTPTTIRATSSSSSPPTTIAEPDGIKVNSIPTKPIEGQKTGTSGLRKKV